MLTSSVRSDALLLPSVAHGPIVPDTIHCCSVMELLTALPDESVNCIVTSPPYFGLRQYLPEGDIRQPVQIGLEPTPQAFVATMVAVFRECRRVLRNDGVLWLNLGDSYASGDSSQVMQSNKNGVVPNPQRPHPGNLASKQLMGIPWRVAFALQDDGWYLRSDVIWAKPNPMPESVTDRPTKSHEYVFLLTKHSDYRYDADAIREVGPGSHPRFSSNGSSPSKYLTHGDNGLSLSLDSDGLMLRTPAGSMRNRRTVWTVATEPTPFAHFATFPRKLIEPMILAGCPDRVCSVCGAPWERVVEVTGGGIGKGWTDHNADLTEGMSSVKNPGGGIGNAVDSNGRRYQRHDLGFRPTCAHADAPTVPGIVLDPFMGSGTTALVARSLGRHYVGCDLNPEYVNLARTRLANADPFQPTVLATGAVQPSLFAQEVTR